MNKNSPPLNLEFCACLGQVQPGAQKTLGISPGEIECKELYRCWKTAREKGDLEVGPWRLRVKARGWDDHICVTWKESPEYLRAWARVRAGAWCRGERRKVMKLVLGVPVAFRDWNPLLIRTANQWGRACPISSIVFQSVKLTGDCGQRSAFIFIFNFF